MSKTGEEFYYERLKAQAEAETERRMAQGAKLLEIEGLKEESERYVKYACEDRSYDFRAIFHMLSAIHTDLLALTKTIEFWAREKK